MKKFNLHRQSLPTVVCFFALMFFGLPTTVRGQAKPSPVDSNAQPEVLKADSLRIIPLRYRKADDAMRLMSSILRETKTRITSDPRTNSLIILSDNANFEVIKGLVSTMDSSATDEAEETKFVRLPPAFRNAQSFQFLKQLAEISNVEMSSNGTDLVTKGQKQSISELLRLIDEYAKASSSTSVVSDYLIRFVVLSDSEDGSPVDAALAPSVARLEKMGYKKMTVVTQCLTACKVLNQSSQYETTGLLNGDEIIRFFGTSSRSEADPQLIDLEVKMTISPNASIGAKVVLAPEKVVLLGTTPRNKQNTVLLVQLVPALN